MPKKESPASLPISTAGRGDGPFARQGKLQHGTEAEHAEAQAKQELLEGLRQGPGEKAQAVLAPTRRGPPPSRWSLAGIRASFEFLGELTLPGLWRRLDRWGLSLRSALVQQYSPDPQYPSKERRLHRCLRETAQDPAEVVSLFLDEMGYLRWPQPGPDWGPAAPAPPPQTDCQQSPNRLWRVIGALDAHSGRVHFLDGYIVGRAVLKKMYRLLDEAYPQARRIYVIQDNWAVHTHPEVLEALESYPRITPIWLPTYAPWPNPIEKLWRWLRQDVLKLHRLAHDFALLRGRVNQFLAQFSRGSQTLLHYVGLKGEGALARCLHNAKKQE